MAFTDTEKFSKAALQLDVPQEVERITQFLREGILHQFRRQGAVVGISGGIDSSVVLALCVRALGAERVLGILMPERESSPESADLAHLLADHFGVRTVTENITPILDAAGCYQRRDEAVSQLFPEYSNGWKCKISLPGNLLDQDTLNIFSLTVIDPQGQEYRKRLPPAQFSQIVAASNFKQRSRMLTLYYHAEQRNYAVVGTPNKNEHALGFFVKYGDGGTDISPIQHLWKNQVYQLARFLEIPEEIQARTPTTDTYSAGGSQEEFFYRIPFEILDLVWLGMEQHVPAAEIAAALDLTAEQVERVIADIQRKQRTTQYLRTPVLTLEKEEAGE